MQTKITNRELLKFYPVCIGHNPLLHPVCSRDFASYIDNYIEDETVCNTELLVGGPQRITWKELGQKMQLASKSFLPCVSLPLFCYKAILQLLGFFSSFIPSLKGIYITLLLLMIPMTTDTASKEFISVGTDTVEEYLQEHSKAGNTDAGWVRQRVFGSKTSESVFMSVLPSQICLSRIVACCSALDGIVALCKPEFVGHLQNIDVEGRTLDHYILIGFGIASLGIAVVTSLSTCSWWERSVKGHGGTISAAASIQILLSVVHYLYPGTIQYSLGVDPEALTDKTTQHIRQASSYFLAGGVQQLALSRGMRSGKAAGLVSLVWFLSSVDFWINRHVDEVFEMTTTSMKINLTFPIWTGTLALALLLF